MLLSSGCFSLLEDLKLLIYRVSNVNSVIRSTELDLKLLIYRVSNVNSVIRSTELFILIMSAPTDMSSLLASLSSTSVAGAAAPRSGDFSGGTSSLGAGGFALSSHAVCYCCAGRWRSNFQLVRPIVRAL